MADAEVRVVMGDAAVGTLAVDLAGNWRFTYDSAWMGNGFPLAPCLPFDTPCDGNVVRHFFANMLPENDRALEHLVQALQILRTNTFGLLLAIRHDLSGALRLKVQDERSVETRFRPITNQEIADRLDHPIDNPIDIWDNRPRLSLAGVQDKINVLELDGQWGLGDGNLCSTHILKFDRTDLLANPRHLVLNEYFSMELGRRLGFAVAEVALLKFGSHRALAVRRFDRRLDFLDGKPVVLRRHLVDGCQALGLPVAYKYERPFGDGRDVADFREGVSIKKLATLSGHCQVPQEAVLNLLDWVVFNLLIGNTDSHGKNYSYFVSRKGLVPTPWYDLLNVKLYQDDVNTHLAMAVGDVFEWDDIRAFQLLTLASDIGIPVHVLTDRIKTIGLALMDEVSSVANGVELDKAEKGFADRFVGDICGRCQHLAEVADQVPAMERLCETM